MLNFRVRDLDAMLAQLRAKGADVAEETQDMDGVGRFGWVTDPEGNRVELWQPARPRRHVGGDVLVAHLAAAGFWGGLGGSGSARVAPGGEVPFGLVPCRLGGGPGGAAGPGRGGARIGGRGGRRGGGGGGPGGGSRAAPPAAASIPEATSGLGPNRGISTMVDRLDARIRPPLIGRNATPVTSGE